MKFFLWTLVLFVVVLPASSPAEFYKYRDDKGVIRYTDNIVEVPKDQQDKVVTYTETKTLEEAGQVSDIENVSDVAAKLEAEKAVLDAEYEQLLAERQQLEEEAKIARKLSENELFEKRIVDYNQRLRQYEEKRKLFKDKVDAYNAVIDSQPK